ncbi:hypothetical protein, partial [Acetobacter senegalensis]|uniref:hypothetical protein n=1 Tax=Acetobacter senegalensis TaxID=446692 RepID=UPI001B7FF2E6
TLSRSHALTLSRSDDLMIRVWQRRAGFLYVQEGYIGAEGQQALVASANGVGKSSLSVACALPSSG